MATLVRYNNFRHLKKGNNRRNAAGASSVEQIKELEVFLKLLGKKKKNIKEKNNKS